MIYCAEDLWDLMAEAFLKKMKLLDVNTNLAANWVTCLHLFSLITEQTPIYCKEEHIIHISIWYSFVHLIFF